MFPYVLLERYAYTDIFKNGALIHILLDSHH